MKPADITLFRNFFANYIKPFYADDETAQAHFRLKENHTARVCEQCLAIGQSLGLSAPQLRLAEAIGLFHDIGRFRQYQQYRTFNDARSTDHGELAVRILKESNILSCLPPGEQKTILFAVICHNKRHLPPIRSEKTLVLAKLIRDADKLDIFELITSDDPAIRMLPSPELPTDRRCSPAVIADLLAGRMARFEDIQTSADQLLFRLSWAYNLYFPYTARRILNKHYFEKMFAYLPAEPNIAAVKQCLAQHLQRLAALD